MRIYLASIESGLRYIKDIIKTSNVYVLGSFFSLKKGFSKYIPYFKDFILDSGAFSFMNSSVNGINWDDYIKKYASFINENNIKKFYELDIDTIVGYEKVKQYRDKLEDLTQKQCIPVWHKARGLKEFFNLCNKYNYIAIGGIVTKDISQNEYKFFRYFINEAHKRNCMIHGLGFTRLKNIKKYHFDSVDSSTWLGGSRWGHIYTFNGKVLIDKRVSGGNTGLRISDHAQVTRYNFEQWIKFQKYAEIHC